MSYITFEAFKEQVKAIVFPEGEAENLVETHNSYIIEALIALQTSVPCLLENNVNVYEKEDVREWCNADFIAGPRGIIQAVYAFLPGTDCKRYFYDSRNQEFVDCWMKSQSCVTCGDQSDDGEPSIARSPECHTEMAGDTACASPYEEADEDDAPFRRASRYYATGPNNKLIVAPRFPCGYKLAVHWEGLKRTFSASDPLPDDMDLITTVAKYVEGQKALRLDKDQMLYERMMHPVNGEFSRARALMVVRCKRERETRPRRQCNDGFGVMSAFTYDPMANQQVFAIIGDYGDNENGEERDAVAEVVDSWSPSTVISVGDNWYGSALTEADLIAAQGAIYAQYNDEGRIKVAIGNHDRDPVGRLAVEKAYFGIGKEYYQFKLFGGLVECFVVDSGYDSSQVNQQADGVTADSIQALWLRDALAASTAIHKPVFIHHSPYTSFRTAATGPTLSNDGYLAYPEIRWPYKEWGASCVFFGHIHQFEWLIVDDFNYINIGCSGRQALDPSSAPPNAGSQRRINNVFGALRCTVDERVMTIEFRNTSNQVLHKMKLRGQDVTTA